ncbi:MAG: YfiR family protein [Acidobacteriota bacterium]
MSGQDHGSRSGEKPSEYEIKAAFLLNFTKFIVWPRGANAEGNPFNICIVGENPFGLTLHQIVEGEKVDGHPIVVRSWPGPPASSCGILFIGKPYREVGALLSEIPEGVLTVGESDDFLKRGGMIALAIENRRVRFDVNARAAAKAGLGLSSRLLNVARTVEGQTQP